MEIRSTLLAAALTLTAVTSQASLVTNGGFESGMAGWTCVVSSDSLCETDIFAGPPEGGAHFIGYDNITQGVLSQSLATVAGASYSISFFFNSNGDDPAVMLAVDVGDLNAVVDFQPLTWLSFSGSFTASSASTDLNFLFATAFGGGSVWIDQVVVDRLHSVPTPASWALTLLGLGLAGVTRRALH